MVGSSVPGTGAEFYLRSFDVQPTIHTLRPVFTRDGPTPELSETLNVSGSDKIGLRA